MDARPPGVAAGVELSRRGRCDAGKPDKPDCGSPGTGLRRGLARQRSWSGLARHGLGCTDPLAAGQGRTAPVRASGPPGARPSRPASGAAVRCCQVASAAARVGCLVAYLAPGGTGQPTPRPEWCSYARRRSDHRPVVALLGGRIPGGSAAAFSAAAAFSGAARPSASSRSGGLSSGQPEGETSRARIAASSEIFIPDITSPFRVGASEHHAAPRSRIPGHGRR